MPCIRPCFLFSLLQGKCADECLEPVDKSVGPATCGKTVKCCEPSKSNAIHESDSRTFALISSSPQWVMRNKRKPSNQLFSHHVTRETIRWSQKYAEVKESHFPNIRFQNFSFIFYFFLPFTFVNQKNARKNPMKFVKPAKFQQNKRTNAAAEAPSANFIRNWVSYDAQHR